MLKWTREKILRELLRRESAALPLNMSGDDAINSALYQAATRIFGSWRNAITAAGISHEESLCHDRWTPKRIISTIRALARRQQPLRPTELRQRHTNLIAAARRYFGTWSKALIAGGIDPTRFCRTTPWTKEKIIEAILRRALKNEPLGSRTVRPPSLSEAGKKVFGTWAQALTAAGLDSNQYLNRHTEERFSCASQQNAVSDLGEGIQLLDSLRPHDGIIRPKSGEPGKNTGKTLQRWTNDRVIEEISRRFREGRPMNSVSVCDEDRSLHSAATRRYRNWHNALRAAGLDPEKFYRCKIQDNQGG